MAYGVSTTRNTTSSHAGQRKTAPGACVKASSAPRSFTWPQWAHSAGLAVISNPNTSWSRPATALPSTISSRLISSDWSDIALASHRGAGRAEALRADLISGHADLYQAVGRRLHQERRAAAEGLCPLAQRSHTLAQHRP